MQQRTAAAARFDLIGGIIATETELVVVVVVVVVVVIVCRRRTWPSVDSVSCWDCVRRLGPRL